MRRRATMEFRRRYHPFSCIIVSLVSLQVTVLVLVASEEYSSWTIKATTTIRNKLPSQRRFGHRLRPTSRRLLRNNKRAQRLGCWIKRCFPFRSTATISMVSKKVFRRCPSNHPWIRRLRLASHPHRCLVARITNKNHPPQLRVKPAAVDHRPFPKCE